MNLVMFDEETKNIFRMIAINTEKIADELEKQNQKKSHEQDNMCSDHNHEIATYKYLQKKMSEE